MNAIPLAVQTLYADLSQKVLQASGIPGSISRKMIDGVPYLYAVERHGAARLQRYLGPEQSEPARAAADAYRREADLARGRRQTITMLKAAGVRGPAPEIGRLLESMSRAGLFRAGLVLVGTVAYQLYPLLIGRTLDDAAMLTQDADFVAAQVRIVADAGADRLEPGDAGSQGSKAERERQDLITILRRADSTFAPAPTLRRNALPSRFVSQSGLDVELLTPVRRRDEDNPVPLPGIGAGAIPLPFLEYLVENAMPAVVVHGAGIQVTVPQPARYAVHKLIVAQRRTSDSPKRTKDLSQAATLWAALDESDPDAIEDALDDARSRGPKWRAQIDAGLRQIGRER